MVMTVEVFVGTSFEEQVEHLDPGRFTKKGLMLQTLIRTTAGCHQLRYPLPETLVWLIVLQVALWLHL